MWRESISSMLDYHLTSLWQFNNSFKFIFYPKNHGISKLVVWRSQTPPKNTSKALYCRVQWFLGYQFFLENPTKSKCIHFVCPFFGEWSWGRCWTLEGTWKLGSVGLAPGVNMSISFWQTHRKRAPCLEDHPRIWIRHGRITLIYKKRPFGRGTTLLRWLINHGY